MAKRFTQQEIDILSKSPHVKYVRENRLSFTYEFRLAIWESWFQEQSVSTVRTVLEQHGFDCRMLGNMFVKNIHHKFKENGKPSRGTNKVYGQTAATFKSNEDDNEYLVSTGKFIIKANGIAFHPDFINELYNVYPNQSIEEGLIKEDIDPQIVGYQRIHNLQQIFDGKCEITSPKSYTVEDIYKYKNHPYVKKITYKQFVLNEHFYNDASLLVSAGYSYTLHIDEILNVFEIEYTLLSISTKNNIIRKLNSWEKVDCESMESTDFDLLLRIARSYNQHLELIVQSNFDSIKELVLTLTKLQRKQLCEWIQQAPEDIEYTTRELLDKVGISKSSYYAILKNESYGSVELERQIKDAEDVKLIKQVMEYKGFRKGSRQIYMMMKRITGVQFGLNKIRRLMRKYGLSSGIRKTNQSRRNAQAMLKRNVKPNLLKRQFRLARPLTIFATDVSYLYYNNHSLAYLSTIKDTVSGRKVACVLSRSNDLKLGIDTLDQLECYILNHEYQLGKDALIHMDQGVLYLSDYFQDKVKQLKLAQSMSRRGNCWDNASQESYFGHFKDECIFKDCKSFEELKVMVNNYVDYYNYERGQWDRMKMTPVEFEKYLLTMSDEDFAKYYAKEKEKYDKMMENAKKKAIERAKDIGAL